MMTMKVIVWTLDASIEQVSRAKEWDNFFSETSNPILGETKTTDSVEIVGKSKES